MRSSARPRGFLACAALLAAAVASPPAVDAQNLLTNPDFFQDAGLSSWTASPDGSAIWDDFECGITAPFSGSARVTATIGGAELTQCVEVTEGLRYPLAASVYLDTIVGRAELRLRFFYDGNCNHDIGGFFEAYTEVAGDWIDLELRALAPSDADSVQVELRANARGDSAPTTVYFDDVVLPEPSGAGVALVALVLLRWRAAQAHGRARIPVTR